MTTRLSQKRVKGSDNSYQSLHEELKARNIGTGGTGYIVPAGGIPLSDLNDPLREFISDAMKSLLIPSTGVSINELSTELSATLTDAQRAYLLPTTGIPLEDLDESLQEAIGKLPSYYVYPSGGIPRVDFDMYVKRSLDLADKAYQKPAEGIPASDLDKESQDILNDVQERYKKPVDGIPDEDLAEDYVKVADMDVVNDHMNNKQIHITHHDNLSGIGEYTHGVIDDKLDDYEFSLSEIEREMSYARESFDSIGARFDSLLGRNSQYIVERPDQWNRGTFTDLKVTEDGDVGFTYTMDAPVINLYDTSLQPAMDERNYKGDAYFTSDSILNMGTKPWKESIGLRNNVGVKLDTYIYIPVTGTYTFSIQFSGRVRASIGNQMLFDTQGVYSQIDGYTRTASIELTGGYLHKLVVEGWYGTVGDRIFGLLWHRPGTSGPQEIKPEYFSKTNDDVSVGEYVSEVIDFNDNNVALWRFDLDADENRGEDDIIVECRVSSDGIHFTDWDMIDDNGKIGIGHRRYSQFRITVIKTHEFYTPVIHGFRVTYVSAAYNEIMSEIMGARDTYTSLKERLEYIENHMRTLTDWADVAHDNLHPEYFASLRLAEQELNTLQLLLLQAKKEVDYISLDNGAVDIFTTTNNIDDSRSDDYEIVNGSLKQMDNVLRLSGNSEWNQWELDKMDYQQGDLRLASSLIDTPSAVVTLSSANLWSTRDTARIAGNYQEYIAQPFYTSQDVNLIKRLTLYTYDLSNAPSANIMICPTKEGTNIPDVDNPIYSQYLSPTGGTIDLPGIWAEIKQLTKYWIVIKRENAWSSSGYWRWYLTYSSNSNVRLRGSNPKSETLPLHYTGGGANMSWQKDTNYYLSFNLEEARSFEAVGTGERIIDYQRPTIFSTVDVTSNISVDGVIVFEYSSSNNAVDWSEPTTEINRVPMGRFLRIRVRLQKSSTGYGSPTISRIDIHSEFEYSDIVTYPITTKYAPTHAIYRADHEEGITFHISRDDGISWKELTPGEYTQLNDIRAGVEVRFKIRFSGNMPLSLCHYYAYSFTRYRDITQQNVTALYEEYTAKEGQQVFNTDTPFIIGNHSLQVFLNGVRQSEGKDYVEVDRKTIMFLEPLIGGLDADRVTLLVAAGAYDMHDGQLERRLQDIEMMAQDTTASLTKEFEYDAEGRIAKITYIGGKYAQEESFEYDEQGQKIKATLQIDTKLRITEYEYDDNGRIKSENITVSEVAS